MRENVLLSSRTTLRLGGPAAKIVDLERDEDVAAVAAAVNASGEPLLVLGGGSNLVVADEGFAGLVACIALPGIAVRREGSRVVVDVAAGEDWDAFVARAVTEGWIGVECMSGIPGRVGATPIQNVGAYGQEVSDTLTSVRVFDRAANAYATMTAAACQFGYRASVFKHRDRYIVTGVRFAFDQGSDSAPVRYAELARALSVAIGERAPLARVRETVLALRRIKGMVIDDTDPESVSAGSFFVNPVVDAPAFAALQSRIGARPPAFDAGDGRVKVAAAWLVERAGFAKGWTAGTVGVSRKHALALVNRGGATTRELLAAARTIRDEVHARFGVTLEPEPVFVGCAL